MSDSAETDRQNPKPVHVCPIPQKRYFGTAILLHELSVLSAASALTGAAMFVMTGFEVFVAFLQAYIFTILSTVYIKLSVEHH